MTQRRFCEKTKSKTHKGGAPKLIKIFQNVKFSAPLRPVDNFAKLKKRFFKTHKNASNGMRNSLENYFNEFSSFKTLSFFKILSLSSAER